MSKEYRQCAISVMDTIEDPNITFDEKGICNYFYEYRELAEKALIEDDAERERELQRIVDQIKEAGRGKPYDCAIGISGGVDSTYVAYQAKKLGLRALAIHFDNGWNSELAVKNIENIVSKLGFDLYTYVVDWDEFRDIQLAYLKASVVDIEAITDHGIGSAVLKVSDENNLKYILSGTNIVTEAVLPSYWIFNKGDAVNIQDIHKKYGTLPIKTFPLCGILKRKYYSMKKINSVRILDYIHYDKAEAKKTIIEELDWRDYGGKHYESIFTRFYQGYILPEKFRIDKRKAHLSNLIFSNQITKEEALAELETPIYPPEQYRIDKEFVLKKFDLTDAEFDRIMSQPRREHTDFEVETSLFDKVPAGKILKPIWKSLKR